MFAPRMGSRGEVRFADFRNKEGNSRKPDVHKPFVVQPACRGAKDFARRQTISPDRHNGMNRPEFTSLADVYEGALRNVLNIQLHLSLDDQQSFTQDAVNGLLHEKPPPALNRDTRDLKARYGRPREDNKNTGNVGSFQGRTFLRDPRHVSPGGSAFHVPPKRPRLDEETPYPRGAFPMDRYGVAPAPDFPLEYPNSFPSPRGSPGMYRRRINTSDALTHAHVTNGMHVASARDYFSLWPLAGHRRDMPALFPLRCSSVERERRCHYSIMEEERRRFQDISRFNGSINGKVEAQVKIERDVKQEKRGQNPSISKQETPVEENSQCSSPLSSKANIALTTQNGGPPNGALDFRMETRYRSALRRLEPKREGKRSAGENGAQDEFLFQLGLERIPN